MKNLKEALFSRKHINKSDKNTIVIDDDLEVQYIDGKEVFIFSVYNQGRKDDKTSCWIPSSSINRVITSLNHKKENTFTYYGFKPYSMIEIETFINYLPCLHISDGHFTNLFEFETEQSRNTLIEFLEQYI